MLSHRSFLAILSDLSSSRTYLVARWETYLITREGCGEWRELVGEGARVMNSSGDLSSQSKFCLVGAECW